MAKEHPQVTRAPLLPILTMLAGATLGCRDAPTVLAAPYHSVRTKQKPDGVLFLVQAHRGSVERAIGTNKVVVAGLLVADHPVACEVESTPDRIHQSEKGTWTQVRTSIRVEAQDGIRHEFSVYDYEGDYVNASAQHLVSVSIGGDLKHVKDGAVIVADYTASSPSIATGEVAALAGALQDQDWASVIEDLVDEIRE